MYISMLHANSNYICVSFHDGWFQPFLVVPVQPFQPIFAALAGEWAVLSHLFIKPAVNVTFVLFNTG